MRSFDALWEEIHVAEEWGRYPSEPVIRFVARNYYKEERKAVKILDFCCGAGSNTWYLAREGFDTYAFDGSESAINKVKNLLEREGLKADLRVRDALEIEKDFDNNFFDCVIDNVSIYANTYGHIVKMYEEIYALLKTGGRIFTTMFSKSTTGYGMGEEIEKGTFVNIPRGNLAGRGTVHFFDREEIESTLSGIGFMDIQTEVLHYTDRGNDIEELLVQAKK